MPRTTNVVPFRSALQQQADQRDTARRRELAQAAYNASIAVSRLDPADRKAVLRALAKRV